MKADQAVTHFAPTEQLKQQQNVMCGYVSLGDAVTTDPAAVTCQDCRDWIGPTEPPPAFKLEDPMQPTVSGALERTPVDRLERERFERRITRQIAPETAASPPPRRVSIDELQRILERDSEAPLQIMPNGEIREVETGERTERKPLTMRENLGGEYAGSSFSVPVSRPPLDVELAAQYKYEPYSPPEDILGSPGFDEELRHMLEGDGSMQNVIDPSAPPSQSATLEKIIEATKYVQRRARVVGPRHVMAIAASLAAEFPGMFAGPDVLRPILMPSPDIARRFKESLENARIDEAPCLVIDSVPPLEKRPGHRNGYRVGLTTKGGGKPPGSKLARKAARGKL